MVAGAVLAALAAESGVGCRAPAPLTQQVEARRLASALEVEFARAVEAANRAVMAGSDDAAAAAARDAERAVQAVARDGEQLRPLLASLGYAGEIGILDAFNARFAEYRTLDAEILPLAVENTNLKAQRLSFSRGREAAEAFRSALDAAVGIAEPPNRWRADALASRAGAALLEIQVLQAPHIAESEDAAMTRLEDQMAASEAVARRGLEQLRPLLPSRADRQIAAAADALEQFMTVNAEVVTLSRRNSNVRSLALSLGRKRSVVAQCTDRLRALQEALAKHALTATR
jgi:hypothetical protein